MATLQNLTIKQLRRVISIKEEIESLNAQLAGIMDNGVRGPGRPRGRKTTKKRRKMSAAGRAKIAAAAKARWAKAKAAGKSKL